jgi:hypothetical protein
MAPAEYLDRLGRVMQVQPVAATRSPAREARPAARARVDPRVRRGGVDAQLAPRANDVRHNNSRSGIRSIVHHRQAKAQLPPRGAARSDQQRRLAAQDSGAPSRRHDYRPAASRSIPASGGCSVSLTHTGAPPASGAALTGALGCVDPPPATPPRSSSDSPGAAPPSAPGRTRPRAPAPGRAGKEASRASLSPIRS